MTTQVDDPATSRGPRISSLHAEAEKYCITCGKSDSIDLCSRCKGVWYCNEECEEADRPCHQLLCTKYAKSNEIEPLDGRYRAFLFRIDSWKPDIVILPTSDDQDQDFKSVVNLLRKRGDQTPGPSVERVSFGFNSRLKRNHIGQDAIQVIARVANINERSEPSKSLLASVRAMGTAYPPHCWAGNVVVRRVKHGGNGMFEPTSATMADLRHALDWFAECPHHSLWGEGQVPETLPDTKQFWGFGHVKGVRIFGNQLINDESGRYWSVEVSDNDPIRGLRSEFQGKISPISKLIGYPLRLFTNPIKSGELDWKGRMPTCHPAAVLMRSLDKYAKVHLPQIAFGLPEGSLQTGRVFATHEVLVIRADNEDLSINEVKAMVYFAETMCRDLLLNVMLTPQEDKARLEAAMQRALDFMNWDNYLLAFDQLRLPRPERPADEAFIDMRGTCSPHENLAPEQEMTDAEESLEESDSEVVQGMKLEEDESD